MPVDPKNAEYPRVPTPKELELSRQLVDLQQEKDQREKKLLDQIGDLESQQQKLQIRIHELSQTLQSTKRDQIQALQAAIEQERAVWKRKLNDLQAELDQEKNDKEAQRIWAQQFMERHEHLTAGLQASPPTRNNTVMGLDPTDDVFARFAQSVALLPAQQAPRVVRAGVLPFLVHLLTVSSAPSTRCDVITGSVLIALVHLAIHERPKRPPLRAVTKLVRFDPDTANGQPCIAEEIVKAGAIDPLAHILRESHNLRVLSEAARLCAALGVYVPNKRVLAAKSVVRLLIDRLTPAIHNENHLHTGDSESDDRHEDLDELYLKLPLPSNPSVQQNMLSALVNLCNDSEIIRSQIVNCAHFVPIVVRYVRESSTAGVQTEAAKLLGNLAANQVVNQSAIMTAEGNAALAMRAGSPANVQANADLVRASAIGIANLAYMSVNQLTIGYGDATTFLLQALVDSTFPSVIEAAATAITSLCHGNPLNKSRVAAQNGLQVLLYVVSESRRFQNDDAALTAACECLAVVARSSANRAQVLELDGHIPLCELCRSTPETAPLLLEASASAICALIPTPRERRNAISDGRESKLEAKEAGALVALERASNLLVTSTHRGAVPQWLSEGIQQLQIYHSNIEMNLKPDHENESLMEFHERGYFTMESTTSIPPDDLCPKFYDSE